jgi:hypothetical protein
LATDYFKPSESNAPEVAAKDFFTVSGEQQRIVNDFFIPLLRLNPAPGEEQSISPPEQAPARANAERAEENLSEDANYSKKIAEALYKVPFKRFAMAPLYRQNKWIKLRPIVNLFYITVKTNG